MYYDIDEKFRNHFKGLKQVFLYVINECNLNCPQCIYKPNNYFCIGKKEIDYDEAVKLITDFYELGARKLTLLGGEPTLYGKYQKNPLLLGDLIAIAKKIGYEHVRIDTNGTFSSEILELDSFRQIDEISFSMDGYDEKSCDLIRGKGVFRKEIDNINRAISLGYRVDVTCCVYQELLEKDTDGNYYMERLIYYTAGLGVSRVNFHALIKDGTPIDLWSSDLQVHPDDWVKAYNEISLKISEGKYPISVRLPQSFITRHDFLNNPNYYGFCPAKLGERVLVHPDGIIRICSGLLGTAYGVANYYDGKICWNNGKTNELIDHDLTACTWCTNRSKNNYGEYVPLCFSFKPRQDEFAYNLLQWEKKRNT
ncbi:MAG: radical SAM protein [Eubacteriales bacterium]|nr:radical SAM protein [Eubacteriales bacterium]